MAERDERPLMCRLEEITRMRKKIQDVAHRHNARRIFVFGSCARGEESVGSDVDFIADFQANASLFDHAALEVDLSDMLECKVDVVNIRRLSKDDAFARAVKLEMLELC